MCIVPSAMCKLKLSYNTWKPAMGGTSLCYTQTTPILQYREPVLCGTSVQHTNCTCPAIQGTSHEWHLCTTHKLHLSCNTENLSWVTPLSTTHKLRLSCNTRVPTRTGKPGKRGRHFPVREKSGNFEQTGKVWENHTKYWKTQGI